MRSRHLVGALAAAVALVAYWGAPGAANASAADATVAKQAARDVPTHSPDRKVLSVYIDGPDYIVSGGTHAWIARASGGTGTYTYYWEYREDNSTTWTHVGTNIPRYTRFVPNADPSFALRVTVTSDAESVTTDDFEVFHEQDPPELTR